MRWKTTGFYYGAQHWFAFLRLGLLYLRAACLQINTSASDVAGNKTSAYIFMEPSPSLRTLVNTGALIVHVRTASFQLNNDIPSRSTLKDFKMSASLVVTTQLNSVSSLSTGSKKAKTPSVAVEEDHGVVFYKKIGGWITLGIVITALVFLTVTHFTSIHQFNRGQRVKEPFCANPKKPQPV